MMSIGTHPWSYSDECYVIFIRSLLLPLEFYSRSIFFSRLTMTSFVSTEV